MRPLSETILNTLKIREKRILSNDLGKENKLAALQNIPEQDVWFQLV